MRARRCRSGAARKVAGLSQAVGACQGYRHAHSERPLNLAQQRRVLQRGPPGLLPARQTVLADFCRMLGGPQYSVTIDRGAKQRIAGAGTTTSTEATRQHKQYATQGPTTNLCT